MPFIITYLFSPVWHEINAPLIMIIHTNLFIYCHQSIVPLPLDSGFAVRYIL